MGYSEDDQGRRSRGFQGARAPLLFCPPRGCLKYIMVLIFPKNLLPAVVHLLYLDQFGALVYSTTYKIVKTTNLIT